jgi:hypothetical protein
MVRSSGEKSGRANLSLGGSFLEGLEGLFQRRRRWAAVRRHVRRRSLEPSDSEGVLDLVREGKFDYLDPYIFPFPKILLTITKGKFESIPLKDHHFGSIALLSHLHVGPHESMTCGVHGIYLKFGSFNGIDPIVP